MSTLAAYVPDRPAPLTTLHVLAAPQFPRLQAAVPPSNSGFRIKLAASARVPRRARRMAGTTTAMRRPSRNAVERSPTVGLDDPSLFIRPLLVHSIPVLILCAPSGARAEG